MYRVCEVLPNSSVFCCAFYLNLIEHFFQKYPYNITVPYTFRFSLSFLTSNASTSLSCFPVLFVPESS